MKPGEMTAEELVDAFSAAHKTIELTCTPEQYEALRVEIFRLVELARLNVGEAPEIRKPLPLKDQVDIARHNGSRWIQVAVAELEPLLNAVGSGQEGRFDTTEKLWDEYRKFRELPAFTKLPLDTKLFAQYVVGHFWGASQPELTKPPCHV